MSWAYKTQKEMKNAYKILVGKSEGTLPFRKKMYVGERIILKYI
jgi:hypothetical protein